MGLVVSAQALGSLFEYKPKLASYVVHKWYHGGMDRATGTGLVRSGGEGCFLVRDSSRAGNLALQFVSHGTVKTTLLYNVGEVRIVARGVFARATADVRGRRSPATHYPSRLVPTPCTVR